jgi:hypothetical protein
VLTSGLVKQTSAQTRSKTQWGSWRVGTSLLGRRATFSAGGSTLSGVGVALRDEQTFFISASDSFKTASELITSQLNEEKLLKVLYILLEGC